MSIDHLAVRKAYEEQKWRDDLADSEANRHSHVMFDAFEAQQVRNKALFESGAPLLGKSEVRKSPLL